MSKHRELLVQDTNSMMQCCNSAIKILRSSHILFTNRGCRG
jgi:hypothetical protein